MRSNFMFIAKKYTFVDENYSAKNKKDFNEQGKKIDITELDKGRLAYSLYINVCKHKYAESSNIREMLTCFKRNKYKIDRAPQNIRLCIDLSSDLFDPTQYDQIHNTYSSNDILTANQCVQNLKKEVEYETRIKEEVICHIQTFLETKDFTLLISNGKFNLYFSPKISSENIIAFDNSFKKAGLSSTPYNAEKKWHCIVINNSHLEIIQSLMPRQDNKKRMQI